MTSRSTDADPLALLVHPAATAAAQATGRNAWWLRAHELLGHHRIGHRVLGGVAGPAGAALAEVRVLLAATAECGAAEIERIETWVRRGGALVLTGPATPLARLAGVSAATAGGDGQVEFADDELWTRRPRRSLHALAGARLEPADGTRVAARWADGTAAITHRRLGDGVVVCFGVDVWQTIARIEQGDPVLADGVPASDGTAPVDDGLLKCEDGLTLDVETDRRMPPGQPPLPADFVHGWPAPAATPVFDLPQADLWQAAVLQVLWWAHEQTGTPLAWLDYWPAGQSAVAHLSHDADQNVDDDARAALEVFAEAGVTATWCHVYPGGYDPEVHREITAAGHEDALHYNALEADQGAWGFEHLRDQLDWAVKATDKATDGARIVSNKNHYTRWEGWTEFYEWCERLGIQIDESRGPSKLGTTGFPFGTAHLSFPMGSSAVRNRPMDVLNLPLHTQDLAMAAHVSVRDVILDGAAEVHGVAHFLFHGPHLRRRPDTRQACLDVVRVARERGMTWWTAGELNTWERTRRAVGVTVERAARGWQVTTSAEQPVPGATVLLSAGVPGFPDAGERIVRHGRTFTALVVDVPAGLHSWIVEEGHARDR